MTIINVVVIGIAEENNINKDVQIKHYIFQNILHTYIKIYNSMALVKSTIQNYS